MTDQQEHFQQVYLGTYTDLVRFVIRRRLSPDQAEDIVAEACTVAWQRLKDLPQDPGEARAWLFGITRRLMLAQHRAETRGQALSVAIAQHSSHQVNPHDELVATSIDLASAWQRLSAVHQEALSLTVWEGLSSAQAAKVLGISPVAFRIRLSRARRILRHLLGVSAEAPSAARTDPTSPLTSVKGSF